jgi:hypothetical protein
MDRRLAAAGPTAEDRDELSDIAGRIHIADASAVGIAATVPAPLTPEVLPRMYMSGHAISFASAEAAATIPIEVTAYLEYDATVRK